MIATETMCVVFSVDVDGVRRRVRISSEALDDLLVGIAIVTKGVSLKRIDQLSNQKNVS